MSENVKNKQAASAVKDAFQAEFDSLPLDEKSSRLFKMEAATIGETINYVVDNSAKAIEKAVAAMNDLGRKVQADCAEKQEEPRAKTSSKTKAENSENN